MERIFAKISKNKFISFLELGRVWNAMIAWIFALLGAKLFLGCVPDVKTSLLLLSVTALIYMGGAALNDIHDIRTDSINMPYRPIVRGSLREYEVYKFIIFCYIFGNLTALLLSFQYFGISILMTIGSIIYSLPPVATKDRGIIGNINLGFATAFFTTYSGMVMVSGEFVFNTRIILYLLSLSLFFTFFSILKDFKDVKGDRIAKKRTFLIICGNRITSFVNITGSVICFLLTIIFFNSFLVNHKMFLITSVILLALLLYFELKVYRGPETDVGEHSWKYSRIVVFLFILSMLLF